MGLGGSTKKRGFDDTFFPPRIVGTVYCEKHKQNVSCSGSHRLILWVPPQAERGGCMQGNGLEKVSRHITHSQVRFRHPFGSPRMVKSKRTEHGAERGLWDAEEHRHYCEDFLGQWQPLLTSRRSPGMLPKRRMLHEREDTFARRHFVQQFGQKSPCRRRWRRRALVVADERVAMGSSARTWCDLAMMRIKRIGGLKIAE